MATVPLPEPGRRNLSKEEFTELATKWLETRGASVEEMAKLVYDLQLMYIPDLTLPTCLESINRVLEKREVQNAIFTGLSLDVLAEQELVPQPLLGILQCDDGLYGIDEILALSILNIYGSIGLTNFGYLDKVKMGIIGEANQKKGTTVNTFLDDLIAAIVAAAASRLAHRARDMQL